MQASPSLYWIPVQARHRLRGYGGFMTAPQLARLLLPFAAAFFGLFGLVLPLFRSWRRHGVLALASFRSRSVAERLMGLGLFGSIALFASLCVVYGVQGPGALGMGEPGWAQVFVGAVLIALGQALVILAQAQMGASWRIGIDEGAKTALVTHGLYAHIRNPIYTGLILTLIGAACVAPGPLMISAAIGTSLLIDLQTRREERFMLHVHGEVYAAWMRTTGRYLPGL